MGRHSKTGKGPTAFGAPRCVPALVLMALALLSIAPLMAGDLDGKGRVLTATGQVSVERERELWVIQPNSVVEPGQVIITGPDGYVLLQLDDGSSFEVFGNSRVTFRANRGSWRDLLDVYLGKVRIHIEKLSGGRPNPYRVQSATALIAVRGTVFEVTVAGDESTTIDVEEGEVAVSHRLLPSEKEVVLQKGESLVVRPNLPLLPSPVDKIAVARGIVRVIDQTLQVIRIGGPSGRGRASIPVPGGGSTGTGGMGQAPPPSTGGIPGDDTGPGATTPPSGGTTTSPTTPIPTPVPIPRLPTPVPIPGKGGQ